VENGLLSGIDLAADDPGTTMVVNVLASVLQFQRDMISENTREGVAAAAAAGKVLGRPAALDDDQVTELVKAYRKGAAVKALARQYGVDPKVVRRVLDSAGARQIPGDLDVLLLDNGDVDIEDQDQDQEQAPVDPPVAVDVPLHRLRHSALTHDAEGGISTPMVLARSRHASVRYLERYARPGVDSVAGHVAERDPAARGR
jgi:putative DNA-invertase from lambdoid prophage Rac